VGKWGTRGAGPGQFQFPVGIAVAADGNVCVSNTDDNQFKVFAPA
jgi:hypothetical protein